MNFTSLPSTQVVHLLNAINETDYSGSGIFALQTMSAHQRHKAQDLLRQFQPDRYLTVYGTLAPGQPFHHLLSAIPGTWKKGKLQGTYSPEGWGLTSGYPAFIWTPRRAGTEFPVHVFESGLLDSRWHRFDDFEGPAYQRILVPVQLDSGEWIISHIYALDQQLARQVLHRA
jgi:gamma-glutamylcyclotransferase (GGCT)/AIG2-like uncharacterized protein YtfP